MTKPFRWTSLVQHFFSTMRNENVMKLEFLSSFQIAVRPVPWGQNISEAVIEFLQTFPRDVFCHYNFYDQEKNIVNIKIIVNSYSNSNATLGMFWPRYWFSVSVNHSWLIAQVIFNSFLPLSLRWLQIIGLAANTIASQDISILLKTFVPYVPYTNWQNEEKSQYLCKRKYILDKVCDSRYESHLKFSSLWDVKAAELHD